MPSNRRQISATAGAVFASSENLLTASRARSTKSRTVSQDSSLGRSCSEPIAGSASERTVTVRSPGTFSPSRLVASTRTPGAAPSKRCAKAADAATRCSQLSSTSNICRLARCLHSVSTCGWSARLWMPRVVVTVRAKRSASESGARSTNHTPSGNDGRTLSASAIARRVLPQPPMPVRVSSRTCSSNSTYSARSSSWPMKLVGGCGRLCLRASGADGGSPAVDSSSAKR